MAAANTPQLFRCEFGGVQFAQPFVMKFREIGPYAGWRRRKPSTFRTLKGSAASSSVIPCSILGGIKYQGTRPPRACRQNRALRSEAARRADYSGNIPTSDA